MPRNRAAVALLVACTILIATIPASASVAQRVTGFGPKDATWLVVNDGVMGGVSSSTFAQRKGLATFAGSVRLENNGGFASVRSPSLFGSYPDGATAYQLRVLGDAKPYQFTVDTGTSWFWFTFTPPKGKWTTISAPFADFQPVTRFGEPTDDAPLTAAEAPRRIGFLISNKRAERFSLQVDWIDVA
jgi:NADH dehydrogenase [ubiquinone] 1 alpha subcomplex assembly factor 1